MFLSSLKLDFQKLPKHHAAGVFGQGGNKNLGFVDDLNMQPLV